MRVVAWNVRSGIDRKWGALRDLGPDVAVLSEAARVPVALAAPALGEPELSWEWEGVNDAKGVAVAAWDLPLRRRPTRDASGRWATAGAIGQLLIVGIWSCPKGRGNYCEEVERSLDAYADQISRHHDVIIAGDFNVAPRAAEFRRIKDRMRRLGLVSAYHEFTGAPFGWESQPTFHARHVNERDQHIDFIWLSEHLVGRVAQVTVGARGPSDHSPVILDLIDT